MASFFKKTRLRERPLSAYKPFIERKLVNALEKKRAELRGLSVLHLNSTSSGGGVAELLRFQVPLERSLGVKSSWLVINNHQNDFFFVITKKMHNLLQGQKGRLTSNEKKLYLRHNMRGMEAVKKAIKKAKPDIIIIHDPQPLSLVKAVPAGIKKIFRLHIDLSTPDMDTLNFFRPFIDKFDHLIVSNSRFRPKWFDNKKTSVIYPAIDPLAEKNRILPKEKARKILAKGKIDFKDPIISQISRFDPWKDPIGVIRAYRQAKREFPSLKLILAGSAASDDPESREVFEEVKEFAAGDEGIILITKHDDLLVNAIQSLSRVVLQKSLREGFGLTVTEAMWKKRAVIGGRTLGIAAQIEDGKNGFLVSSSKQAAERIIDLLKDRSLAAEMGRRAHLTVKKKFLAPKMVYDHLKLYGEILL